MRFVMRDNTAAIARIDVAVAEIRAVIPSLATKDDFSLLAAKLDRQAAKMDYQLATKEDLSALCEGMAELRGQVKGLPTAWVMVTAIMAGQVALVGVLAGAVQRSQSKVHLNSASRPARAAA